MPTSLRRIVDAQPMNKGRAPTQKDKRNNHATKEHVIQMLSSNISVLNSH